MGQKYALVSENKRLGNVALMCGNRTQYEFADILVSISRKWHLGDTFVVEKLSPRWWCGILLGMHLTLAHIGGRPASKDGFEALTRGYLERCSAFVHCGAEVFRGEEAMIDWLAKRAGRTPPIVVLLDSRGRTMTSEAFAAWLGARRDAGAQHILFAVGPASGWSDAARQHADLLLSLGSMTLAHALARLVLAEQLYRAFAILSGHPYHAGH
jgi:23S rRNA (pseudouridine1915-N3)-methyltransferase